MGKAEKPEKTNKKQKHFWKDFKAELKKVIWPTKSQVANNTIIVIAIVIIVTAIVFVLDLVFEAFNKYGIDKLKETIQNTVTSQETNNGDENKEENTENTENNNEEASQDNKNNGEENTDEKDGNENNETPEETANN